MKRALAVLLLVGSSMCAPVLVEVSIHAQGPVIKDPADVRPGMADKDVIGALQTCCSARSQVWTLYLNNGVVVMISHDAKTVEPLSAFELLQIVTDDLAQHCPPDSPSVFAERGPGKIDAFAHQVSSPNATPTNPDQVRWMSSIGFACSNHRVGVVQVPDGRAVITISDAIPNLSRRYEDSLEPQN